MQQQEEEQRRRQHFTSIETAATAGVQEHGALMSPLSHTNKRKTPFLLLCILLLFLSLFLFIEREGELAAEAVLRDSHARARL